MELSGRPGILLRGGGIAVAAAFALSTQFLFQLELYETWPLAGVLRGWLDYFAEVLTVVGIVFAGGVVLGGRGYAVYNLLRRSATAASQAHESELQRIHLERQTAEAHLQSL